MDSIRERKGRYKRSFIDPYKEGGFSAFYHLHLSTFTESTEIM